MPLGMEVDLGLGDCVQWGPTSPQKKAHPSHPIFGPSLLWANAWMNQDATWYGGKFRPRRRGVRWGRSSHEQGMAGWMKTPTTEVDLSPGHNVLDGVPAPRESGYWAL